MDEIARGILPAARHNCREFDLSDAPQIDPSRTHRNYTPLGPTTAAGILAALVEILTSFSVKVLRRDAVLCLEAMFSLPADTGINVRVYFAECLALLMRRLGCPLLSAVVHLDEAHHHMHVLMVPISNGRLCARELMGGYSGFMELRGEFLRDVAAPFGLKASSAESRKQQAEEVIGKLRRSRDPVLKSRAWAAIKATIEAHPGLAWELICQDCTPVVQPSTH